MAKPAITKRTTKGAALTYAELDNNFQNIVDATISLTAGSGGTQVTADLNGNITLVAGSNITLTGNNTAKTITIDATGGATLTQNSLEVGAADLSPVQIFANDGVASKSLEIIARHNSGAGASIGLTSAVTISNASDSKQSDIFLDGVLKISSFTSTQLSSMPANSGRIVYNSTTNKFQGGVNGTWTDLH